MLKDASSASIYGSRASNGVIIITTKKAKKGVTRVDFSTFLTVQTPGPHIRMLNTLDYGRIYGQAALNDGIVPNLPFYNFQTAVVGGQRVLTGVSVPECLDAAQTMRTADTDWFNEIQRNALIQSYNLSISNGGERGGVLFSGTREALYRLLEHARCRVFDVNLRPPHYTKEVTRYLLEKAHLGNCCYARSSSAIFVNRVFAPVSWF